MNIASVSGIPQIGGGVCKKNWKKNLKKFFSSLEKVFLIPERLCPAVQN